MSDFGVTTLLSFVTKRKFAPPVSSTFVLVAGSRYMILIISILHVLLRLHVSSLHSSDLL